MHLEIPTPDGNFQSYVAFPASGTGPGIMLLQEIFGVSAYMRAMADLFAAEGFVAVVPDLFWRQKPGVDLDYSERDQAFAYMKGFDSEKGVVDMRATVTAMREHPAITGKVAAVGYCLGGKLAVLAAAHAKVDAAVGYYGVGIEGILEELRGSRCPLMLHFGELDHYGPPEVLAQIRPVIEARGNAEMHVYQGADHGFNSASRANFNQIASLIAHRRTMGLLSSVMGSL